MYFKTILSFIITFVLITLRVSANITVTVNGTNGTCVSNASLKATVKGNSGTVYYELLQGATVIRNYQVSNQFDNLPAGVYVVQVQDAATAETQQSNPFTLKSSYVPMVVIAVNGTVSCPSATNGSITVNVTGGNANYSFAITSGPVTKPAQSAKTFNNLPVGNYMLSVTDACGVTVSTTGSVALGTSTTSFDVTPAYGIKGNTQLFYSIPNDCSSRSSIQVGGAWGYRNNRVTLSNYDKNHFYWRYIYPTGSNKIYGVNGQLNGAKISCNSFNVYGPEDATYPFADADFIIYDECGDSTIIRGNISSYTAGSTASGGFDCEKGGYINVNTSVQSLVCLPVYWKFVSRKTGLIRLDTSFAGNNNKNIYGFIPGETYDITAVDFKGKNPTNSKSVTIPATTGSVFINQYIPDYSSLGASFPVMIFPPTISSATDKYSYVVKSSSTGNPAVGFTGGHSIKDGTVFGNLKGGRLFGPNPNGSWPEGDFTVTITVGCITNDMKISIGGANKNSLQASMTDSALVPVCGAFNISLKAKLDNPSLYAIKILPGSASNVGYQQPYINSTVPGVYSSPFFNGLGYGKYYFGLITNPGIAGGEYLLATKEINYIGDNRLTINALTTGGYICPGNSTGQLTIDAVSASRFPIQYSIDNGKNFQQSNLFPALKAGQYPVVVRDSCGNTVSYNASILSASELIVQASSNKPCEGTDLQFTVNAAGATSYSWSGPNGFASAIQNPVIRDIRQSQSGIYEVVITTNSCNSRLSVPVAVQALPVASISYSKKAFCKDGFATPVIKGNLGGVFTSSAGLIIDKNTGVVDLRASNPGLYKIKYIVNIKDADCTGIDSTAIVINPLPEVINSQLITCAPAPADLTKTIAGRDNVYTSYGFYLDSYGSVPVENPGKVTNSAAYYVKATYDSSGCYSFSEIKVTVQQQPVVFINQPAPVCFPATVDLTSPSITVGSTPGLAFSYYSDADTSIPVQTPDKVSNPGTYYLHAKSNSTGCISLTSVEVKINKPATAIVAYSDPSYCATGVANVSLTGFKGGNFDSEAGVVIDAVTGAVDLSASTPGNYKVNYHYNNGACSNTTSTQISILPLPSASIKYDGNPYCAAGTAKVSLTGVKGGYFSSSQGLYINTVTGEIDLVKSAPGIYTVNYVFSDTHCSNNCNSTVVINALPTLVVHPPAEVCAPGKVDITASQITSGSGPDLLFSYFSDTSLSSQLNAPAKIEQSGTYYIMATSKSGCASSLPVNVTVHEQPLLKLHDPNPVCVPGTVNLTLPEITKGSSGGLVFSYYKDNAGSIVAGNPDKLSVSGIYFIQGKSSVGCLTDALPVSIKINQAPVISVVKSIHLCKGDSITLTALSPGNSIKWLPMNISDSIMVKPETSTSYLVVATTAEGCGDSTYSKVEVEDFVVKLNANPDPVLLGKSLELKTSASVPYKIISWEPKRLFGNQTEFSQYIDRSDVTSRFLVTAQSSKGCPDTASVDIVVNPDAGDFFIPNAFTPNGDGNNDVFRAFGSSINTIRLFVYNQWGQLLFETSDVSAGWDGLYRNKPQPSGVYLYKVRVKLFNGTIFDKKGTLNLIR